MVFSLTFKTPDVIDQLAMNEEDLELAKETVEKFVEYGEYITIQFDTEEQSATVI